MMLKLVSRNIEVNKFRGIKLIHFWIATEEREINILLTFG